METLLTLDGDGYGDGSGDGYGDGYGSGSGYGSGYGDGYGDGSPLYWLAMFKNAVAGWTETQRERLTELYRDASAIAFWKSDAKGLPSNGGKSKQPAEPGRIEEIQGPLQICTHRALHATMQPEKWKGERLWVVALHGETVWQDDKCAALKREIIGEVALQKAEKES